MTTHPDPVPPAVLAALLDPALDAIWAKLLRPLPAEAAEGDGTPGDPTDGPLVPVRELAPEAEVRPPTGVREDAA